MARILYLSRNYPNNIFWVNGLWVEGLVSAMSRLHDVSVVAPVQYTPPLPEFTGYARYRKILEHEQINGVDVYRPRYLSPPGYWLHSYLGKMMYRSIVGRIDRLRSALSFDLIHAHFIYPDGYVAALLAQRYKVPFVVTEHAAWVPWMVDYPKVAEQAVWTAANSAGLIAGSRYLGETISKFTGNRCTPEMIPIGFDHKVFSLKEQKNEVDNKRILYVGRIHPVKGVDVLFRAMNILIQKDPDIRLTLVGGDLGFRHAQLQEEKIRKLAVELGIESNLEYVGRQKSEQVAELMRNSALLVLPSRRESFGAVLVEAMACGTPVVATRCGGPEDFVKDNVGVLVEKENAQALADGIEMVLDRRDEYQPSVMSRYAHDNFSWESVATKTSRIYERALLN